MRIRAALRTAAVGTMPAVPAAALAAALATGLVTLGPAQGARSAAAPSEAGQTTPTTATAASSTTASVTPQTTTWRLDATRFGTNIRQALSHRPCLQMQRKTHRTVLCLVSRKSVKVRHIGYKKGYLVPAKVNKGAGGVTLQVATADLMLRPGRSSLSEKCGVGCTPKIMRAGSVKVPVRVLTSCKARSPWLFHGVDTSQKIVALTLDDGPSQYTRKVLRILRKAGVPATFFVVGVHANTDPTALRKIRAKGHVLANHSYNHANLSTLPAAEVMSELQRTNSVIRGATSFTPCAFRAPYGENPPEVVSIGRQLGMDTIHWNAGAHDYLAPPASEIIRTTLGNTKPGSIILLHDGGGNRTQTLAALPTIIKTLRDRGYRFLTVPDMLGLSPTYK